MGEDEADIGLLDAIVGALGGANFDLHMRDGLGDTFNLFNDAGTPTDK
jgi:hypothetical protein